MATNECNYVPEFLPNKWRFEFFAECGENPVGIPVSSLVIYKAVILEAFLWGLGTALGELPPYFVARAGKP